MRIAITAILGFMLGALAYEVAHADTLTWTWLPPTERTDGTALPADQIQGYGMKLNGVERLELLSQGTNQFAQVFPSGEVCAEFRTHDVDGRVSVWTEPVCKAVLASPNEPSSVTVTITIE